MNAEPRQLSLADWDHRYDQLRRAGLQEPDYGGPLGRHLILERDLRLQHLRFDNSAAALRLWNFLLTENQRLDQARDEGDKLVGAMKDLGTVPVMACSFRGVRAFYPDGAWWTPCLMECSDGLFRQAEKLGLDASFCPVRAMVPAFLNEEHFPRPDLIICSTGAVCDDFSAIAQRLEHLGHPVFWWEMPRRRVPDPGELVCALPGRLVAPESQVRFVRQELERVRGALSGLAGYSLSDAMLADGIRAANEVRGLLRALRETVYSAPGAPLPALEMLVAEMLALHFCSDRAECPAVLQELLDTAGFRARHEQFVTGTDAARIFWVNPVADLRAMNLLEEWGGRICGTDYMFAHALDAIDEDLPPMEALARTALADPMVGSTQDRASRIVRDCGHFRAEAVVVSRIPGASHCAREGGIIRDCVQQELDIPVIELEIPTVCDAMLPALASRIQALVETVRARRPS